MTDPDVRLVRALEQLGAEHEPPPGWQARVLAALEPGTRREPRRRRRWCLAIPAAALAAGALLSLWPDPAPLTLVVERGPSAPRMRGGSRRGDPIRTFAPGEPIRVVVRGGERRHALRVYRDGGEHGDEGDLVAACPGHAACRGSGGALTLELTLSRVGTYRVVAWASAAELPAPGGAYEADVAAATGAGATWQAREVEVR